MGRSRLLQVRDVEFTSAVGPVAFVEMKKTYSELYITLTERDGETETGG